MDLSAGWSQKGMLGLRGKASYCGSKHTLFRENHSGCFDTLDRCAGCVKSKRKVSGKKNIIRIKPSILFPYDPAILLLGIYPNELKTYVHTKTCTWMFTAALLRIAKTWKQPRCPSIGEWVSKLWHVHIMEYCSVVRRNELSRHKKDVEEP